MKKIILAMSLVAALSAFAEPIEQWHYSIFIKDESASNTLPMTELGSKNWPNYYTPSSKNAKAWKSTSAETNLEHSSGWAVGGIIRSEASLNISPDLVDAMALADLRTDPQTTRRFQLQAQTKSWAGRGVQIKTPWQTLGTTTSWKGRIQGQWLEATKLRQATGEGVINYSPTSGYLSDVSYSKNYASTKGYFLSPPDNKGVAGSLSFFARKELENQDFMDVELIDFASLIKWNLVRENASLNNLSSPDIPQGIQGVRKNIQFKERMDKTYKVRWAQSFPNHQSFIGQGRWILEANHRSDLTQAWLGWGTGNFSFDPRRPSKGWAMSVAHDPLLGGSRLIVTNWGGYLQFASDKFSKQSHIHSIQIGWGTHF